MVKKHAKGLLALALAMAAGGFAGTSCDSHEGDEDQLKADADSFATYYYNWHFVQAAKYCTPGSERWLSYMASNVRQRDIDSLRSKAEDATVEIGDIQYGDDGTSATVSVSVSNFLQMDSIGSEPHLVVQSACLLPMTLDEGRWKVRMDSPLRSGRQSRGSVSDE